MNRDLNRQFDRRVPAFAALAASLLVAIGCGGPAHKYGSEVSGTVTIDGELAPSGTVTFHPVAKDGKIAIGRIYPDGSFSLRTGQGDLRESDGGTVVPGEYIVTVVVSGPPTTPAAEGAPPGPGVPLIDKRYNSRDTSELRQTVTPGDNIILLELDGPVQEDSDTSAAEGDAEAGEELPADAAPAESNVETPTTAPAAEGAAP